MQLALSVPPSRAAQRTSPSAMSPALLPAARAAATRHATPRERAADPSASWSRTPQTPSDARTRKVWLSSRRSVVTSAASLMPPPRHSLPPRARATATCAMGPPQVRRHPQVGVGPHLRYPLWSCNSLGAPGGGGTITCHLPAGVLTATRISPPLPQRTRPPAASTLCTYFRRAAAEISPRSRPRPPSRLFCASAGSDAAWSRVAKATNVDGSPSPPASSPPSPPPSPRAQSTVRQSPQLTTYRDAHSTRPALVHQDTSISRPKASLAEPVLPHQRHARARTVLLAALAVALRHRPPRCREGRRLARADRITHGGGQSARGVQRRPWPSVAVEARREHVRRRAALAAYWTGCAVRAAASLQPRRGRALEDVCGIRCPVASAARVRLGCGLSKAAPHPRAGSHGCVRSI